MFVIMCVDFGVLYASAKPFFYFEKKKSATLHTVPIQYLSILHYAIITIVHCLNVKKYDDKKFLINVGF